MISLPLPIETSRLRLRPFVPGDLAALYAVQSHAEVHRWLYSEPRSEEELRGTIERRIARVRDAPETGVALVVELAATGEFLGDVTLTVEPPEQRQGEIGFIFHPEHQGRGYATEASAAVLALAFGTYDLHRVYGRLEARNLASARVLEKLGMRKEAHLVENEWVKGEWQSEAVYALLAREWHGVTKPTAPS
jgi:RimJ/RimL family protein N-acetyltransferase